MLPQIVVAGAGDVKRSARLPPAEMGTAPPITPYVAISTPGSRNCEIFSHQDHPSHSSITRLAGCRTAMMTLSLSDAIVFYFLLGLRHWEILMFLTSEEGISMSMSTLRRHLKSLGLFRRKAQSDVLQVLP